MPEEYPAAERVADFKSERYQGKVYAMAGASDAHNLVELNAGTALNHALAGRECTVRGSDVRLQVRENGLYTYPDLSVVCGPPRFAPGKFLDTLLNLIVLGEVSSESRGGYDRADNFLRCVGIPSLRHYLLLESTRPLVHLATWRESKVWAFDTFEGLTAVVPLSAIGVELALADIYRQVPLAD